MTPATERIALAVVTRDRPELLARFALRGLEALANEGYDVVVVDQSAGPETEQLVRPLARVRYVRSPPGLSRGRNTAVDSTGSELLAFADDDVTFEPGWLGAYQVEFDRHAEAGAVCGRGRTPGGTLLPGRARGEYRWPTVVFGLGSGFNVAFRREALAAAGPFDEQLGAGARFRAAEDTDMLYRILRVGWSVVCSDNVTVVHHDWRPKRRELPLHYGYGVGAGAQSAKHVASGDRQAGRLAARHAAHHLVVLARSLPLLRLRVAGHQLAFLAGLATGYVRRRRADAQARAMRR